MVTADEVKKATQTSASDEQIETLISLVTEMLEENYYHWTDFHVINIVQYHLESKTGKSSLSLSRYSASYTLDMPNHLLAGLTRKGRFL